MVNKSNIIKMERFGSRVTTKMENKMVFGNGIGKMVNQIDPQR